MKLYLAYTFYLLFACYSHAEITKTFTGKFGSNSDYKIQIVTDEFSVAIKNDGGYWGTDEVTINSVVSKLSFTANGKTYFIPKKAYSDICDMNSCTVKESNGDLIITFRGGDAAGAFNAIFVFRNSGLWKRTIKSSELPEHFWEESIYHNRHTQFKAAKK